MENQKEIDSYIKKITKPIFNKVLQEENPNSMTTTPLSNKILFRPHNYRREIKVKTKTDSTLQKIAHETKALSPKINNKLISIKNYKPNITIQYGKETVTAIFSQNIINGHKETYLIERNNKEECNKRLNQIINEIKEKIDNALNDFIDRFNLRLEPERKPIWTRYEEWIKGEEFIDSIPRETIIHDTTFKKVYPEGIEFKSSKKGEEPLIHLKSYINNRSIEEREPIIAKEINNAYSAIIPILSELNKSIHLEIRNKKLHQRVLRSMDKTLKQIRDNLSQKRLKEYI